MAGDVILAIVQTCVERSLVRRSANDMRNILSCVVKVFAAAAVDD
jgi:hypothetical protein